MLPSRLEECLMPAYGVFPGLPAKVEPECEPWRRAVELAMADFYLACYAQGLTQDQADNLILRALKIARACAHNINATG